MANSTEEERMREVVVVGAANVARLAMTITTQYLFQIPKEPCVNYVSERNTYMNSVLSRERKCKSNLRMRADAFHRLCALIRERKLLEDTRNCEVEEMVMRFLHLIGHNVRHRVIESRYYRSLETISRQFNETLDAILKLYPVLIADHGEATHNGGTPSQILDDTRYEKYYKNCLGALDGTHIVATVPGDEVERFRSGRKSFTSQNVLAACSFDLKFTYVLVGWEGTAHDQRVLDDARTRRNPFRIPQGKYYLADAGYCHEPGILTPYRVTRYHLNEFSSDRPPENERELFNHRHSTLRNAIERAFGVLKKRFPMLSTNSHYSFKTQTKITMACFIIHNHIMGVDPNDPFLLEVIAQGQNPSPEGDDEPNRASFRAEQARWLQFRDSMARKMFFDYRRRRCVRNDL